jgi:hypothetical protein
VGIGAVGVCVGLASTGGAGPVDTGGSSNGGSAAGIGSWGICMDDEPTSDGPWFGRG